jgi:Caspase domain
MSLTMRRTRSFGLTAALLVLAAASAEAQERPDVYVLAVGVSRYRHANVADLPGCVNDAKNAAEQFGRQAGKAYRKAHVRVLLDAEASKAKIDDDLRRLATVGKSGDHVVLFLSGHGGLSAREWSFLPHDYDPADAAAARIADSAILALADTLARAGKKAWIIVDACHSGQLRLNARTLFERYRDPARGGVLMMVSSMPQQASATLGQHSAFAHALEEALEGKADFDHDGKITLKELRRYVYSRVHELVPNDLQDGEIDYSLSLSDSMILAETPSDASRFPSPPPARIDLVVRR